MFQLPENFEKIERQRTQVVRVEKRKVKAVGVHALNDLLHRYYGRTLGRYHGCIKLFQTRMRSVQSLRVHV